MLEESKTECPDIDASLRRHCRGGALLRLTAELATYPDETSALFLIDINSFDFKMERLEHPHEERS